jgi:uncharacterized protein (DUF2164 family)
MNKDLSKRQWDMLSEQKRQQLIPEIITFVSENLAQQIGVIAAEDFLDFFLQNTARDIYNKGVNDARKILTEKIADLQIDFDQLGLS